MELSWIFGVAAIVLGLAAFGKLFVGSGAGAPKRYAKSDLDDYELVPVLNRSELRLYLELEARLPTNLRLSAKPRVEDVIGVRKGLDKSTRMSRRGRVKSRHFDMLVMDQNGRAVAAIELDGPTHSRRGVSAADKFKNELCAAVRLPLLRAKTNVSAATSAEEIVGLLCRR